ncbi:hypothetical protein [Actinomadura hallensis]|uniref:hypothetical protein n=1 Tax=Actinomadura hallensis TaxID=337895 RepID=UPI001639FB97|nr:hypothetical protein [Actinomadura hallensis]
MSAARPPRAADAPSHRQDLGVADGDAERRRDNDNPALARLLRRLDAAPAPDARPV